jgi:hypothetical protein
VKINIIDTPDSVGLFMPISAAKWNVSGGRLSRPREVVLVYKTKKSDIIKSCQETAILNNISAISVVK